jgi:hypothetical protein
MEVDPMDRPAWFSLFAILLLNIGPDAQQCSAAQVQTNRSERFVVIVTTKSGMPVSDLLEQDFTVFDNNSVSAIKSFRVVKGSSTHVEIHPLTKISSTRTDANAENLGDFPRYEITINAATAVRSKEYRQVGIKVDRPNLKVLARQGYYAQFSDDQ